MAETRVPGPAGYSKLLGDLKQRIQAAQLRASLAVNRELVFLYWNRARYLGPPGAGKLGSKGN
jgi:hypothetical protein